MAETNSHFHPSEVAMLILGYMKDKKLHKTFECFLKESKDLQKYWQLLKQGVNPDLNICGYDLTSMLEEYAANKLKRTDQGEPILPGPKPKCQLSEPERIKSITEVEDDRLKQEHMKELKRINNQAYREKQKAGRDQERIERERKKAAKKLRAAQKAAATKAKVSTLASLNKKGLTPNSLLYTSSVQPSPSEDILQEAVAQSGIAQRTHEENNGDARRSEQALTRNKNAEVDENRAHGENNGGASGSEQALTTNKNATVEEDYNFLDQLLDQTHLAERLATYINQSHVVETHKKQEENNVIEKERNITSIAAQTTLDPAFRDFLSLLQGAPFTCPDTDTEFSIPALDHNCNESHIEPLEPLAQTSVKDSSQTSDVAESISEPTEKPVRSPHTETKESSCTTIQSPGRKVSTEKPTGISVEQCTKAHPAQKALGQEFSVLRDVESNRKSLISIGENDKSFRPAIPEAGGLDKPVSPSTHSSKHDCISTFPSRSVEIQQDKDMFIKPSDVSMDIDVTGDGYDSHNENQEIAATDISKTSGESPKDLNHKKEAGEPKKNSPTPGTSRSFVVPEENSLSVFSFLEREAAALLGQKFVPFNQNSRFTPPPERMTAMSVREESQLGLQLPEKVTSGSSRRKGLKPKKANSTYLHFFNKKQNLQKSLKSIISRAEPSTFNITSGSENNSDLNNSEKKAVTQTCGTIGCLLNERSRGKNTKNLKLQKNDMSVARGPESLLHERITVSSINSTSTTCASLIQSVPKATSLQSHSPEQTRIREGSVGENAPSTPEEKLRSFGQEPQNSESRKSPPLHDSSYVSEIELENVEMIGECLEETLTPLLNELTRMSNSSTTQNETNLKSHVSGVSVLRPSSCPNIGYQRLQNTLKRPTSAKQGLNVSSLRHYSAITNNSERCLNVSQNELLISNCSKSLPAFSKGDLKSSYIEGERVSEPCRPKPRLPSDSQKKVIAFHNESSAFTPSHCFKPPSRRIAPVEVSHHMPSPLYDSPFSPVSSSPASTFPRSTHTSQNLKARTQSSVVDAFSVTLGSPPRCRQQEADSNSPGKLRPVNAFSSNSLPSSFTNQAQNNHRFTVKPAQLSRFERQEVGDKRTVITFHSNRSAFTPIHCQKQPSRRIAPTEVLKNVPSPLQASPLRSPTSPVKTLDLSDNLNIVPNKSYPDSTVSTATEREPNAVKLTEYGGTSDTSAEIEPKSSSVGNYSAREASSKLVIESSSQEKKSGLSLPSFENMGISLPPSPSRRQPRRVALTQISRVSSKGSSSGALSSWSRQSWEMMPSPSFHLDESKIVTSSSDLPPSQSKEQAFKLLKSFICSYTKPQPQQEITSTNQKHHGTHKKKKSKKSGHGYSGAAANHKEKQADFLNTVEQKSSKLQRVGLKETSGKSVDVVSLSRNGPTFGNELGTVEAISYPSSSSENCSKISNLGAVCNEEQANTKEILDTRASSSSLDSASFAVVGTMEYRSPVASKSVKDDDVCDKAQTVEDGSSVNRGSVGVAQAKSKAIFSDSQGNVGQRELHSVVIQNSNAKAQTNYGNRTIIISSIDATQIEHGVNEKFKESENIVPPVSNQPNQSSRSLAQGFKHSAPSASCPNECTDTTSLPVAIESSLMPSMSTHSKSLPGSNSDPKISQCNEVDIGLNYKVVNSSSCNEIEQRNENTGVINTINQAPSVEASSDKCSTKPRNNKTLLQKKKNVSEGASRKAKKEVDHGKKCVPLLPALGIYPATINSNADQEKKQQSSRNAVKYPLILPKGVEQAQGSLPITSISGLQQSQLLDHSMSSMRSPQVSILPSTGVFTNLSTQLANNPNLASLVMSSLATLRTPAQQVPATLPANKFQASRAGNKAPMYIGSINLSTLSSIPVDNQAVTTGTKTQGKLNSTANSTERSPGIVSGTWGTSKMKPISKLSLDKSCMQLLKDQQSIHSVLVQQSSQTSVASAMTQRVTDKSVQESLSPNQKHTSYTSNEMVTPPSLEETQSLAQKLCGKNVVLKMANRRNKKPELVKVDKRKRYSIYSQPRDSTGKFIKKSKMDQVPHAKSQKSRQRNKIKTKLFDSNEPVDRADYFQDNLSSSTSKEIKEIRKSIETRSESDAVGLNSDGPLSLEPPLNPSQYDTKVSQAAIRTLVSNSEPDQKHESKSGNNSFDEEVEKVLSPLGETLQQDTLTKSDVDFGSASNKNKCAILLAKDFSPESQKKSGDQKGRGKKCKTFIRESRMSPQDTIEAIVPRLNSDMMRCKDSLQTNLSFENRSLLSSPDTPRLTIDLTEADEEDIRLGHSKNNHRQVRKRKLSQHSRHELAPKNKKKRSDETSPSEIQFVKPHEQVQYTRLETKHHRTIKILDKPPCFPENAVKTKNVKREGSKSISSTEHTRKGKRKNSIDKGSEPMFSMEQKEKKKRQNSRGKTKRGETKSLGEQKVKEKRQNKKTSKEESPLTDSKNVKRGKKKEETCSVPPPILHMGMDKKTAEAADTTNQQISSPITESQDRQIELEKAVAVLEGYLAAGSPGPGGVYSGHTRQVYISPVKHLPLKKRHLDFQPVDNFSADGSLSSFIEASKSVLNSNAGSLHNSENMDEFHLETKGKHRFDPPEANFARKSLSLSKEHGELQKSPKSVKNVFLDAADLSKCLDLPAAHSTPKYQADSGERDDERAMNPEFLESPMTGVSRSESNIVAGDENTTLTPKNSPRSSLSFEASSSSPKNIFQKMNKSRIQTVLKKLHSKN